MQNRFLQAPVPATMNLIYLIYRACASNCTIRTSGDSAELHIPQGILEIFKLIESRNINSPNILFNKIKSIAERELHSVDSPALAKELSSLYRKLVKLNSSDYFSSHENIGEFEKYYSDAPLTTTHHEIQQLFLAPETQYESLIQLAGLNGYIAVAKWCMEKQKLESNFFDDTLNRSIIGGHANFMELLLWQKKIDSKVCNDLFVTATNANQGNIIRALYLHNNVKYNYDVLEKAILTGAEKGHHSIIRHACVLDGPRNESYYQRWSDAATLASTHGHLLVFKTIFQFHSSHFKNLQAIEFGISIAAKNGHVNFVFFLVNEGCSLAENNFGSYYLNEKLTWLAFDKALENKKNSAATAIFINHYPGLFQFGLGLFDLGSSIKLNKDVVNKVFTNYMELIAQEKRRFSL